MAFWIKIFFGVCRIVIGGRFSAPGHERGGSSCSLCSIFCETENLQLQISPLSHLARTADACRAHYSQFGSGSLRCGAAAVAWKQRIKIEISAASISAPDLCSSVSPVCSSRALQLLYRYCEMDELH